MLHMSRYTDFRLSLRLILQDKNFVIGRFKGFYYCSNLKFYEDLYRIQKNQGIITHLSQSTDWLILQVYVLC